MTGISTLWRIRGTLLVPNEADDSGLISRAADILVQHGATVTEESQDAVRYSLSSNPIGLGWLPAMDRGEVRREGIRGRRVLRYDLLKLSPLLSSLVAGPGLAFFLWHLLGDPRLPGPAELRLAAFLPALGILGHFALIRRGAGPGIRKSLRRAFQT